MLDLTKLVCWHDGEFKLLDKVAISPLDFGFIHSEATYDVLRVKDGKIMFLDLHLNRYRNSCEYFGFQQMDRIETISNELIKACYTKDAFLWLISWRGIPPSGSPRDINAPQHNLIYVKPYYGISSDGLNLCIDRDHRRTPDICHNQEYKNFSWIEFNLAQRTSISLGYDSALLMTIDDYVSEGPGFGVCFVKGDTVFTPAKDCLKSITIEVVESLCKKLNLKFERCNITEQEALNADEAFICSTSGGITPIKQLEEKVYANTVTLRLKEEYDHLV
jgi:branched-chain amino acid aminotransferase